MFSAFLSKMRKLFHIYILQREISSPLDPTKGAKKRMNIKEKKDRKTEIFKCRITENQLKILEKNSSVLGKSKNDFFREQCCELKELDNKKNLEKKELVKLKMEIKKIGNNLNQIARVGNSTGTIDSKLFDEKFVKKYTRMLEKLDKLTRG